MQVQGLVRKRDHFWSVTLFLVNGQAEPKKLRDTAWLFQPELVVESPDHGPIFQSHAHRKDSGKADPVTFAEEREMAMLYRHHVEFGVGHGVSLHADCPEGVCDKARRLATVVVPTHEVPRTVPPTAADWPKLAGLVTDMKELGETPDPGPGGEAAAPARRLCRVDRRPAGRPQEARHGPLPGAGGDGPGAVPRGPAAHRGGPDAAPGGRAGGRGVPVRQPRHVAAARPHDHRPEDGRRDEPVDERAVDVPANRSWYPFQLAFVLLNLPGITRLDHPDRSEDASAVADLLWFPTGGGKTEAYLGLSAYTMGLRRLQGAGRRAARASRAWPS